MTKIKERYKFQWALGESLGTWEDAPVNEAIALSQAIEWFDYLSNKYPDRRWRVVKVTKEVVWPKE